MDEAEKRERIEMALDELEQAIAVLTGEELKDERSAVKACREALKAKIALLEPPDKLA